MATPVINATDGINATGGINATCCDELIHKTYQQFDHTPCSRYETDINETKINIKGFIILCKEFFSGLFSSAACCTYSLPQHDKKQIFSFK